MEANSINLKSYDFCEDSMGGSKTHPMPGDLKGSKKASLNGSAKPRSLDFVYISEDDSTREDFYKLSLKDIPVSAREPSKSSSLSSSTDTRKKSVKEDEGALGQPLSSLKSDSFDILEAFESSEPSAPSAPSAPSESSGSSGSSETSIVHVPAYSDLSEIVKAQSKQIQGLQKEVESSKLAKTELKIKVRRLEEEGSELYIQLEKFAQSLGEHTAEVTKVKSALENNRKELEKVKKLYEDKCKQIKEKEVLLKSQDEKLKDMEGRLKTMIAVGIKTQKDADRRKVENDKLKQKLDELQKENESDKELLEELRKAADEIDYQNIENKKMIIEKEQRIQNVLRSLKERGELIEQLKRDVVDQKACFLKREAEAEVRLINLEGHLEECSNELMKAQYFNGRKRLENEFKKLAEDQARLEKELKAKKEAHNKAIAHYESLVENAEADGHRSKIEAKKRIDALEKDLAAKQEDYNRLLEKARVYVSPSEVEAKQRIDALEKELKAKKEAHNKAIAQYESLVENTETDGHRSRVEAKKRIDALEKELKAKKEAHDKGIAHYESLVENAEADGHRSKVEAKKRINTLEKELTDREQSANKQHAADQNEINRLKEKLAEYNSSAAVEKSRLAQNLHNAEQALDQAKGINLSLEDKCQQQGAEIQQLLKRNASLVQAKENSVGKNSVVRQLEELLKSEETRNTELKFANEQLRLEMKQLRLEMKQLTERKVEITSGDETAGNTKRPRPAEVATHAGEVKSQSKGTQTTFADMKDAAAKTEATPASNWEAKKGYKRIETFFDTPVKPETQAVSKQVYDYGTQVFQTVASAWFNMQVSPVLIPIVPVLYTPVWPVWNPVVAFATPAPILGVSFYGQFQMGWVC